MIDMKAYRESYKQQIREGLQRDYEECLAKDPTVACFEERLRGGMYESREQMLTAAIVYISRQNIGLTDSLIAMAKIELPDSHRPAPR